MTKLDTRLDFALNLDFGAILKNPILDIAARLWEEERYEAFRVCYRSMRIIDDIVDSRKSAGGLISSEEVSVLSEHMLDWLGAVRQKDTADEFTSQFATTMRCFDIPLWPWERLCRAMEYDLTHDGFSSFLTFTRYAEGAAIAPAAIFMHLCGVQQERASFTRPKYDIRWASRPLALFSYLVHIMRDFEIDQTAGLQYFADSIVSSCGLTRDELKQIALTGDPNPPFRELMGIYQQITEHYRQLARARINLVLPYLDVRYQLSVELIYSLYLQIFERINPVSGNFTKEALNPTPAEIQARIEQTIEQFSPAPTV